ncbi:MAG: hypothetical protein ACR2G3_12740 [Solirubrobacterales bacterium]
MSATGAVLADFWQHQLVEHDRQWIFLVLLGLLGSFGFIRMSTRLIRSPRVPWWPGSVVSGSGVHVHHLVFGIVLMMIAGTLGFGTFTTDFLYGLCAVVFGIGIGLTLDEFALWVYLDDVYWAKEGRSSVDAAVIAASAMGLLLIGVRPFDLEDGGHGAVAVTLVAGALAVGLIVICFMKKRVAHGVFGFFLLPFALYGAIRLGKPGSGWARRFYGDRNPAKQARAERRFDPARRTERFKEWLRTLIGGSTEADYEQKLKEKQREP